MTVLERMKLHVPEEPNDALFLDCIETAKAAILSIRFPSQEWPTRTVTLEDGTTTEETYVEPRYQDLLFRMALDRYNKIGAEGQLSHSENGISRGFESSWISEQLLREVTPFVRVV